MSDPVAAERKERAIPRRFVVGSYKGALLSAYDDPQFLQAVEHPDGLLSSAGAEVWLEKRNRIGVVRLPLSGGQTREIVVKEFSPRGVDRLKSFFLPSKALRAWRGALALEERSLQTAPPVAYLEKRKAGFVEKSFFLAEKIDGAEEIRHLFRRLSPEELNPLLASLANHLRLCHDRGILHRDLSDGNILVKSDEGGKVGFYLLDTNRIRVRKALGQHRRVKNLIRLGVPAPAQDFFLRQYYGTRIISKGMWLWYKINKGSYAGYVATKKKLRLRQISRRLRIQ